MKHFQIQSGRNMVDKPTWNDINQFLATVKGSLKYLTLECINASVPGTKLLSVDCDEGLYLLATYCKNIDGEPEVYHYQNTNADDSWAEIGCYEYPMEILTDDFDLIVSMFKEFYEKGTVSAVNFQYDFSKTDRV